jgi:hypothetical protein
MLLQDAGLVTVAVAAGRITGRVRANGFTPTLVWAPDGRRFAYSTYHGRARLFVMDADGKRRRFLAYGDSPVWAPDGRTIAYFPERGDIASIRADGTGLRRLTGPSLGGFATGWPGPVWVRGPIVPAPFPHPVVAAPRPDGAVLHTYFPVAMVVAAGTRVALVSPQRMWVPNWPTTTPLVLWDARSGRVDRMSLRCQQPRSVAVLDDRVAYDCPNGHAAVSDSEILAAPLPLGGSRPVQLSIGGYGDGVARIEQVPERIAGSGRLLVFSTSLADRGTAVQLWRADGNHTTRIARGHEAGVPVAADSGRVAIEEADGKVALLSREGRLLGRVAPGGRAAPFNRYDHHLPSVSVGLSRRDLVVLRAGRLSDYDTTSFRLVRSWRVGRGSELGGVANGLVAYVTGTDVHVLRLLDGRSTTIHTRSRSAVKAALTGTGLFYVLHGRPVPKAPLLLMDEHPPRNPATVVYLRRAAIIRQLG